MIQKVYPLTNGYEMAGNGGFSLTTIGDTFFWIRSNDIALGSNINSAGAFIYINDDGNVGVFTSTAVAYADYYTQATALADLDDGGDLELIVGKANGGGITEIFQNDGAGNFSALSQVNLPGHVYTIDIGDINGDGFVDLLFGTFSARDVVLINDGAGNFTDNGLQLKALVTQQARLGDLDIAAAGKFDSNNDSRYVWNNNGNGQFVDSGGMIEADEDGQSEGVGLADFDGD